MFCKHCGVEIQNEDAQFCPTCGKKTNSNDVESSVKETAATSSAAGYQFSIPQKPNLDFLHTGEKYVALRLVSKLYKIAAVIVAILGIASSFASCASMSSMGRYGGMLGGVMGAVSLVGCAIAAITLWALAEAILVFLAIEENTRKTAENTMKAVQREEA